MTMYICVELLSTLIDASTEPVAISLPKLRTKKYETKSMWIRSTKAFNTHPHRLYLSTPCFKPKHACALKPEVLISWNLAFSSSEPMILLACGGGRELWPLASSSGLVQHRKSAIQGLPVKSGKSDWLRIRNKYSAHAQKIGSGQSSRSLTQARRIVGSGDENGNLKVDYSRDPCLSADQKTLGLWERD